MLKTMFRSFGFVLVTTFTLHDALAFSWVDPATPDSAWTTTGMKDDRQLTLVFSDEFETDGRSFADGNDTRWTSEDRPSVTNAALHYYNSSHVTTKDGRMSIQTTRQDSSWVEYDSEGREFFFDRDYQSAMVTTWNKFCFTSGMIEISVQLPGSPSRGGLWPAFWMLGNLARPNYLESTDGVWPWSYDECGTSEDAVDADTVQLISNCKTGKGRGSPEIDIIEAQPGDFALEYEGVAHVDGTNRSITLGRPQISSSLQLAPGVSNSRRAMTPNLPQDGEWYSPLYPIGGEAYGEAEAEGVNYNLNNYWYGQLIEDDPPVWQDGLSMNWQHSESYYTQQTVIRTEWQAGKDDGYVRWYNGEGQLMYEITADTLKSKPGAADAIPQIPYEAMYLILNTDISPRWGWNGCDPSSECMQANPGLCSPDGVLLCTDCSNPDCLKCNEETGWLEDFCSEIQPDSPAEYLIDYVRVYQDLSDPMHTVGCDPPGYPTTSYIQDNWQKYTFNSYIKTEALTTVTHGGAECTSNENCQGISKQEGVCVSGVCLCRPGWTGPNCVSPCIGQFAGNCDENAPPPTPAQAQTNSPTVVTPSPTNAPVQTSPPTGMPVTSDPTTLSPTTAPPEGTADPTPPGAVATNPPTVAPTSGETTASPTTERPAGAGENLSTEAPVGQETPSQTTPEPTPVPTTLSPVESGTSVLSPPPNPAPSRPTPAETDLDTPAPAIPAASTPTGSFQPTPSPTETLPTECSLNERCAALGLAGQCCPTVDNWMLDCCVEIAPESQCESNSECAALGLEGACCPTMENWMLDCCRPVPDECLEPGACEVVSAVEYLEMINERTSSTTRYGWSLAAFVGVVSLWFHLYE